MPSQYPGGQAPYPSQVFLLLPSKVSLGNWIMPKKVTAPLWASKVSSKQRT